MNKIKKVSLQILIGLSVLYLLLLIPDSNNTAIIKAIEKPFVWDKDAVWLQLENDFKNAFYKNKLIGYVGLWGRVSKKKSKTSDSLNAAACNYQLFNLFLVKT